MEIDDIKTFFPPSRKIKIEKCEYSETYRLWKGRLLAVDPPSCLRILLRDLQCETADTKVWFIDIFFRSLAESLTTMRRINIVTRVNRIKNMKYNEQN